MVFAAFVFAVGNMAIATADGLTSFGTGGYAGGIRSREVMNKIDTDGDGMISRAEWNAFHAGILGAEEMFATGGANWH
jgi:hypothetical protein